MLAIFLSPHFDDIALSCGGTAARLARRGARCIALTVFAAPAPEGEPLSPFAESLHAEWQRAQGQPVERLNDLRREEERAALKLLGLEARWLHFPDAPYRTGRGGRHLYTSDEELFGAVSPEERRELVPRIAAAVRKVAHETGERGPVRVFAPLGIGSHVDHQLAFAAARSLPPRYAVAYYEDYPYAGRPGAFEARTGRLRLPMQARSVDIGEQIGVKIAAIARYRSQLTVLFGTHEAMPGTVRAHFRSVAGGSDGEYAERFWYIPPVYTLK